MHVPFLTRLAVSQRDLESYHLFNGAFERDKQTERNTEGGGERLSSLCCRSVTITIVNVIFCSWVCSTSFSLLASMIFSLSLVLEFWLWCVSVVFFLYIVLRLSLLGRSVGLWLSSDWKSFHYCCFKYFFLCIPFSLLYFRTFSYVPLETSWNCFSAHWCCVLSVFILLNTWHVYHHGLCL